MMARGWPRSRGGDKVCAKMVSPFPITEDMNMNWRDWIKAAKDPVQIHAGLSGCFILLAVAVMAVVLRILMMKASK